MSRTSACATCGTAAPAAAVYCGGCGAALGSGGGAAPRDLTRYLCAAAYLDREYATSLVEQIVAEPHLGVAPAPACDVPVVLRHAYQAGLRRHYRDLVLGVLAVLAVFCLFNGAVGPLLLMLFLSWVTVLIFELSTRYGERMQSLRPDRFDPEQAPPAPDPRAEKRIGQVADYGTGNVTVYSGYSPFVGYGDQVHSWSFVFDITRRGESGETPAEFDVADLYAHVARRLETVALPRLEVEERVFVDGAAIVEDERFLPERFGRPVARIDADRVTRLKQMPEDRARTYLAVHSTGWEGHLVTSLFLRFARSESNLLVEGVHTVLCPLRDRYRSIDTLMVTPSLGEFAQLVAEVSVSTLFVLVPAPWRAVAGFFGELGMRRQVRRQDQRIKRLGVFDYGARLGVRQQASNTEYQRYFQKFDSGMSLKVCERRALDALVEFADERGIDVGDLVERRQTIVNNGIIAAAGSSVEGSSVASGKGSKALVKAVNNMVKKIS